MHSISKVLTLSIFTFACSSGAPSGEGPTASASEKLDVTVDQFTFPIVSGEGLPWAMTPGPASDGGLFFTKLYDRVSRITITGTITDVVGTTNLMPISATLAHDGAIWGTGLTPDQTAGLVWRLASDGTVKTYTIPTAGNWGIDIVDGGEDGAVYVTELGTAAAIGRVALDGSSFQEIFLKDPNAFPYRIISADDSIFFSEQGSTVIGNISPDDLTISELPLGTGHTTESGLGVGYDGALWIAGEQGAIYSTSPIGGSITVHTINSAFTAESIIAGPDGAMWFVANNYTDGSLASEVGRVLPSGAVVEYPLSLVGGYSKYLVTGPDGNLWFTRYGDSSDSAAIGRVLFNTSNAQTVQDCSSFLGDGSHGTSLGDALFSLPAAGGTITFACGGTIHFDGTSVQVPTRSDPAYQNQQVTIAVGLGVTTPVVLDGDAAGGVVVYSGGLGSTTSLTLKSLTIQNMILGAVDNLGAHVALNDVTLMNNDGSALYNENFLGATAISNVYTSTIANNTSTMYGSGAAITNQGGIVNIVSSTIAGNVNKTTDGSGGIYNDPTGGTVTIDNTIVAENSGATNDCSGTITDYGYNFEGATSAAATECGFATAAHDLFGDPRLDSSGVQENTNYATYSPPIYTWKVTPTDFVGAWNNGDLGTCVGTQDERGWTRAQQSCSKGVCCTIGAYEPAKNE